MRLPSPTTVAIAEIDLSDRTYQVTTESALAPLVRSMATVGMLNPPVLSTVGQRWRVIAGFRRVLAGRTLGLSAVDCRILPKSFPRLACALVAITDNTAQRELNPVELSRAYRLLSKGITDPIALPKVAESVGLPSNPALIEKVRDLCRMPDSIQQAVLDDRVSLSVVGALAALPEAEAEAFVHWFASVPHSLNRQREAMTLVREIAGWEKKPLLAVLKDPALMSIVEDSQMDAGQKARALRDRLRRRRYPALSRAEREFERRRRALSLPAGMQLVPPKNFEGGRYELRLFFQRVEELANLLSVARRLSETPELAKMIGEEEGKGG